MSGQTVALEEEDSGSLDFRQIRALALGCTTIYALGGIVFGFAAVFPIFQEHGNFASTCPSDVCRLPTALRAHGPSSLCPASNADDCACVLAVPHRFTGLPR